MKIRVNESPEYQEIEVVINCESKNEHVLEIEQSLTYLNKLVTGKMDGRSYTLTPNRIYYFESIDDKVFAYTKDNIYEIGLKLYQLEEIFMNTPLTRINKNTILNLRKIKTFVSSLNGKMEAVLLNGEKMIMSRKYVSAIRQLLGGAK